MIQRSSPRGRLVPGPTLLVLFLLGWSCPAAAVTPPTQVVDSYYWPAGSFLSFGALKQVQKDRLLAELDTKLTHLRQSGKTLLIRGELLVEPKPEVAEFNPASILDQSGFLVIVNNFPNIYYQLPAPDLARRRNTAFVMKNPQLDRTESILRQAVVLRGEFLGFSQAYIKATADILQKSRAAPTSDRKSGKANPR